MSSVRRRSEVQGAAERLPARRRQSPAAKARPRPARVRRRAAAAPSPRQRRRRAESQRPRRRAEPAATIGSSCSSHARMPVSATASTMRVEREHRARRTSRAAAGPITSADRRLRRRPAAAGGARGWPPLRRSTARRRGRPTRRARARVQTGSAPAAAGAHRAPPSAAVRLRLLHVAQALPEERDDVAIVERVEHHAAVAARAHQPQAAQQAQLVGRWRTRSGRAAPPDRRRTARRATARRACARASDRRARETSRPARRPTPAPISDARRRATRAGSMWKTSHASATAAAAAGDRSSNI